MKLTNQAVAIVGFIVGGVVLLAAFDKETTGLFGLAVGILLPLGLYQQGEIKNAANGTTAQLVSMVRMTSEHLQQLASQILAALPPAPPGVKTIEGESAPTPPPGEGGTVN